MSSKKNVRPKEETPADERFTRVKRDPRFWEMPERERKIKIDKRFTSMFHDERFSIKSTVDKRGRPIETSTAEDLRRFYQISEDDSDEEEEKDSKEEEGDNEKEVKENEDDASEEDDEDSGSDSGEESGPDLARGKGNVETSSDEDGESDVDDILQREEEEIQHDWGELCKDTVRNEQVWPRLAICNVDWDRLKAKDLLAILNSFKPEGGVVLSVKIYPSEFGKERLKLEESHGPLDLKALPEDSEDDTEDDRVYREKRRDYQFKRLKYFYAVAECDSAATAAQIYQECDGYEYESSCTVLDLRFIPDEITFEDSPKDVATNVNLATYTPKRFTSSANATSKVELTWDETDQDRVSALNRKFDKGDLLDMDFKAYLASSSEDEEEEEEVEEEENEDKNLSTKTKGEDQIQKYRRLLLELHDKERNQEQEDKDMEITWVPGLKETTEQLVKKKLEEKEPQPTPWEDFLKKKKEKKKKKNHQKKGNDESESELSSDEIPSDVDLDDPFFSSETLAADVKNKNKNKKKKEKLDEDDDQERVEKHKAEMSLLVDDEDERHKHFNYDKLVEHQNLSKKKKKKLLKKGEALQEDTFKVDVSDRRFEAMFTSHLYNLDPSHPSYKKTRGTQSIQEEKRRRRQEEDDEDERRGAKGDGATSQAVTEKAAERDVPPETSKDASLSLLVKSIKSKTKDFQARKRAKLL